MHLPERRRRKACPPAEHLPEVSLITKPQIHSNPEDCVDCTSKARLSGRDTHLPNVLSGTHPVPMLKLSCKMGRMNADVVRNLFESKGADHEDFGKAGDAD
jgi:hypothetical protein